MKRRQEYPCRRFMSFLWGWGVVGVGGARLLFRPCGSGLFGPNADGRALHVHAEFGGFGAGLAVFMFAGFVKNIPLEIEEAAMIDGCNPVQVFFKIVLPIMKPTYLSVGILETMWVWNDYLLPYLTLDSTKYKTIPILIQYFRGGYGHVELGPMMACIMMVVIPIVIMYILCQKYIIDGVVAGAVKG